MTNPNSAIGTNAAFNGRTSPNAINDIAASFTSGIVSGWTCSPKAGMTVQLGGSASVRDVALAEDNAGDKLTINNRSGAPVEVTLAGAPATNNRIDAIVAYVDNPSTGDDNTTDNPSTCGIIAVSGTVAANPVAPNDTAIRAAITTDGATGGVAYYVVLATILVGTNVTTIGSGVITQGKKSGSKLYPVGSIYMSATMSTAAEVEAVFGGTWIAWGAGRVPVGVDTSDADFDTAEETGGEKTHTLTVAEIPAHRHTVQGKNPVYDTGTSDTQLGWHTSQSSGYRASGGTMDTTGGDGAHNNLQPYITCYMYRRTA